MKRNTRNVRTSPTCPARMTSSSDRTSTRAVVSSTTLGSSTPAASSPHPTSSLQVSSAPASPHTRQKPVHPLPVVRAARVRARRPERRTHRSRQRRGRACSWATACPPASTRWTKATGHRAWATRSGPPLLPPAGRTLSGSWPRPSSPTIVSFGTHGDRHGVGADGARQRRVDLPYGRRPNSCPQPRR